jgi:hypothetical protein
VPFVPASTGTHQLKLNLELSGLCAGVRDVGSVALSYMLIANSS